MLTQGQSQNVSATSGRDRKTPKMALYFTIAGSCLSLATGFYPGLNLGIGFVRAVLDYLMDLGSREIPTIQPIKVFEPCFYALNISTLTLKGSQ